MTTTFGMVGAHTLKTCRLAQCFKACTLTLLPSAFISAAQNPPVIYHLLVVVHGCDRNRLTCSFRVGTFTCCKRFYLRFQHHTTEELSQSMNELFGPPGTFSYCRQLGARVAIVGPDCRAERTINRIISPEAYEELFKRCAQKLTKCRLTCCAAIVQKLH